MPAVTSALAPVPVPISTGAPQVAALRSNRSVTGATWERYPRRLVKQSLQ